MEILPEIGRLLDRAPSCLFSPVGSPAATSRICSGRIMATTRSPADLSRAGAARSVRPRSVRMTVASASTLTTTASSRFELPMKSATKALAGLFVDLPRRPDLLDAAVRHDDDPIRERERLALVVRDVDRRLAQPPLQFAQLLAHRDAELEVEVRQRLVEQQDARLEHDRTGDRDALLLAAGKLARIAVGEIRTGRQD